ncbi:MAG TPA: DUF6446 family protein, partial [Amaricoccus sp.]|nr:DUF6446 family protein [Amaricoccus sp.]
DSRGAGRRRHRPHRRCDPAEGHRLAIRGGRAPRGGLRRPGPRRRGLLVAALFYALHAAGIAEVAFDTHARDILLLIFFTGIGLNARLAADLAAGTARAYAIGRDSPAGFDLMLAVYPDGHAFLWRQLGAAYAG